MTPAGREADTLPPPALPRQCRCCGAVLTEEEWEIGGAYYCDTDAMDVLRASDALATDGES